MQNVFLSVKNLEARAKNLFALSESVMIENAASALECEIRKIFSNKKNLFEKFILENRATKNDCEFSFQEKCAIFILCGSGNNGADGYALARKCANEFLTFVLQVEKPKSSDCKLQEKSARNAGAIFVSEKKFFEKLKTYENFSVIVDCIFGTGFHGFLPKNVLRIIQKINEMSETKIACDVASGIDANGNVATKIDGKAIAFFANQTIAMGALKLAYFGDDAKNFSGTLQVANIGITRKNFENCGDENFTNKWRVLKKEKRENVNVNLKIFLLEKKDVHLPFRKNLSSNKGDFGHLAVFAGDKVGAAMIAGSAAFSFGCARVTLVASEKNCAHFKLPIHLMLSEKIPKTSNTFLLGSGFGLANENAKNLFSFLLREKKSCVLDADIFYYDELFNFLKTANAKKMNVVLTPHPKELSELFRVCKIANASVDEILQNRILFLEKFITAFPNVTLVSKSAVTMIASEKNIFISNEGTPALSKGGTGDVLAGMIASLLSQKYSAKDASITAVFFHSEISKTFGKNFSLRPEKLISEIEKLK